MSMPYGCGGESSYCLRSAVRRSANGGARLEFNLPVGAAGGLADSLHVNPYFSNFIRSGSFNKELHPVGVQILHAVASTRISPSCACAGLSDPNEANRIEPAIPAQQ